LEKILITSLLNSSNVIEIYLGKKKNKEENIVIMDALIDLINKEKLIRLLDDNNLLYNNCGFSRKSFKYNETNY